MKILFICHGNVGRSQMAEGYYNHLTKSSNAISAGVDPTTPARWEMLAPEVLAVMNEEGINLSSKKVKFITEAMVAEADKVFILCKKEECPDFLLQHSDVTFWPTKDPFQASIEETRATRDVIKEKILALLKAD